MAKVDDRLKYDKDGYAYCPVCGSHDVEDFGDLKEAIFICNKCGWNEE